MGEEKEKKYLISDKDYTELCKIAVELNNKEENELWDRLNKVIDRIVEQQASEMKKDLAKKWLTEWLNELED